MAKNKRNKLCGVSRHRNSDQEWENRRSILDELSRCMRDEGRSYRGFKGGTAALAWGHDGLVILGGANYKMHDGERRHRAGDYCAEMEVIKGARKMRCEEIIGMVVTCPHQPDDMAKEDFGVTVSCYYCRVDFRSERLKQNSPLKGHTRLRFNHPTDLSKHFEKTIDEFLAIFPNDPPWIPKRGGT